MYAYQKKLAILEVSKLRREMGGLGGVVEEKIVAEIVDRGMQDAEVNRNPTSATSATDDRIRRMK